MSYAKDIWKKYEDSLRIHYKNRNIFSKFNEDKKYLRKAFLESDRLWNNEYNKIDKIKYIILAEAPLCGFNISYIYNPNTNFTQFMYKSDLVFITNRKIKDKSDFHKILRENKIIIMDIFPYALNESITAINYKKMKDNNYKKLFDDIKDNYIRDKINKIMIKKDYNIQIFYRYSRIQKIIGNKLNEIMIDIELIKSNESIHNIWKKGGGLDKEVMKNIIDKIYN